MKIKLITITIIILSLSGCKMNGNGKTEITDTLTNIEQDEIVKSTKTIQLTKEDFLIKVADYKNSSYEWKYLGDKPCLIDFYADWCAPCKIVAPILEELAAEYEGQIYIYKIDTEKESELAAAFGIQAIPTLLFVPMNEAPQIAQGAIPKQDLKSVIEEVLLNK